MADESPTPAPVTTDTEEVATSSDGIHNGKAVMAVKIYAPFQVYFEGDAFSVSAENATGPFDILPKHHNFLCMLVPCTLTVQPAEGEKKKFKIHRALMHVKANRVVVFMDV